MCIRDRHWFERQLADAIALSICFFSLVLNVVQLVVYCFNRKFFEPSRVKCWCQSRDVTWKVGHTHSHEKEEPTATPRDSVVSFVHSFGYVTNVTELLYMSQTILLILWQFMQICVYHRSRISWPSFFGQPCVRIAPGTLECRLASVSYTHLDVYKRQALIREPSRTSFVT